MNSITKSSWRHSFTSTSALIFRYKPFTPRVNRFSTPQTSCIYIHNSPTITKNNLPPSTPRYFSTTPTPPNKRSTTLPSPSTDSPNHPAMSSTHQITDLKSSDLLTLLANRRSYYTLNSTLPVPASTVKNILTSALRTVPSSFNSQTSRVILLLGSSHHKLWDITAKLLREHMGEERWSSAPTAGRIAGFRAAAGSVLFYEDTRDVENNKSKFSAYAQHFDAWSEQTSGMHQLAVWVALAAEGFGANLQHYNPMIDADVKKEFGVEDGWKLRSQMVFGGIEGDRPAEKDKKSTEVTMKVFE